MASKKGGLGRGLGALLGDIKVDPVPVKQEKPAEKAAETKTAKKKGESPKSVETQSFKEGVTYISIDDIKPNAKQARKVFEEDALKELSESIRQNGVIQPVIVRQSGKAYELVAGERRVRASRLAGLKEIPAIVRDVDDDQLAVLMLLENLHREDLNAIEEAEGISELIDDKGFTQEEAAEAISKSRPYIANALRLLKLPQEVKDLVSKGVLSAGHAKAIAGLENEKDQIEIAKKAAAEGWSVRKIESGASIKKPAKAKNKKAKKDPAFAEAEEKISRSLGTKVRINGSEAKGKVEIEYYSRAELDRLIEMLEDM